MGDSFNGSFRVDGSFRSGRGLDDSTRSGRSKLDDSTRSGRSMLGESASNFSSRAKRKVGGMFKRRSSLNNSVNTISSDDVSESRSRDASVDSRGSRDWGDHKVPSNRGDRPLRATRRASMSDALSQSNHSTDSYDTDHSENPISFRIQSKALCPDPSPVKQPKKYKTTRRRMSRRNSMGDSSDDETDIDLSVRSERSALGYDVIDPALNNGSMRQRRRSSLDHVYSPDQAPKQPVHSEGFRMGRRSSLNNVTPADEPLQPAHSEGFRMGRRSSLNNVTPADEPLQPAHSEGFRMGRRSSLNNASTPTKVLDDSNHDPYDLTVPQTPIQQPLSSGGSQRRRRTSLTHVSTHSTSTHSTFHSASDDSCHDPYDLTVPQTPTQQPLTSGGSQRMGRRSSLTHVSSPTSSSHARPVPKRGIMRRNSMNDSIHGSPAPAPPQRGIMRRSSMNDSNHGGTPFGSDHGPRSAMRRSSLTNATSDFASDHGPRTAMRRSSLTNANTSEFGSDHGTRSILKSEGRSAPAQRGILRRTSDSNHSRTGMGAPPQRGILRRTSMNDSNSSNMSYTDRAHKSILKSNLQPPPKRGIMRRNSMNDSAHGPPVAPQRGVMRNSSYNNANVGGATRSILKSPTSDHGSRTLGAPPKRGIMRRNSMNDSTHGGTPFGSDHGPRTVGQQSIPKRGIMRRNSMNDSTHGGPTPFRSEHGPRTMVQQSPAPKRGIMRRNSMNDSTHGEAPRQVQRGILRQYSGQDSYTTSDHGPRGIMRKTQPSDFKSEHGPPRSILRGSQQNAADLAPIKARRRTSLSNTNSSYDTISSDISDRSSYQVATKGAGLDISERSSRRNSLDNSFQTPQQVPMKSALKGGSASRRSSLNNSFQTTPLDGSYRAASRRSSLNGSFQTSPLDGSMRRSSMNNSLNGSFQTTPLDGSHRQSVNLDGSYRTPMKSALKGGNASSRSSLSTVTSPIKTSPTTPASIASVPFRNQALSVGSSKNNSISNIGGAPLGSGSQGYCVPLKSLSGDDFNDRTTSLNDSATSLSKLNGSSSSLKSSGSAKRGVARAYSKSGSNYYKQRGNSSDSSLPTIPLPNLNESPGSGKRGVARAYSKSGSNYYKQRGNSSDSSLPLPNLNGSFSGQRSFNSFDETSYPIKSSMKAPSRGIFLNSGSDDDSTDYASTDDNSVARQLDEMETNSVDETAEADFTNLVSEIADSDTMAATSLFPERSSRERNSRKVPTGMLSSDSSHSTNESRHDSAELMSMESNDWDDNSQPRRSSLKYGDDKSAGSVQRSVGWADEDDGDLDADLEPELDLGGRQSISWDNANPHSSFGETTDSDEESLGFDGDGELVSQGNAPEVKTSFNLNDMMEPEDSDNSVGSFAADTSPKHNSRGSLAEFKPCRENSISLMDAMMGGGDPDNDSNSSQSDGIIRDDEIFQDALGLMEDTTPALSRDKRGEGTMADYTLNLSGSAAENTFLDKSEKSVRFSVGEPSPSKELGSDDDSENSFQITDGILGLANPAGHDNVMYAKQLAYMRDDDQASFMSCSSEEYASSEEFSDEEFDKEKEKEKKVKEGLMWGIGGMAIGAAVGWIAKKVRGGSSPEEGVDELGISTIDDLGKSLAESVLDDSMASINFTGSDQLIGWASGSLGDGGASLGTSAEFIVGAIHGTGADAAIISAATGGAGGTTSAAATAAATQTMAVSAAGNVASAAVTTTTAVGQSAAVTAGVAGGAAGGSGAAAGGGLAALGLSGTGSTSAAVMGSGMAAMAIAGGTYYSETIFTKPTDTNTGIVRTFVPNMCPHPNPDNQTATFKFDIDVSGMEGEDVSWGWMPFSNGKDLTSESAEDLKDLWEELLLNSYNDITDTGCNELFERRLLDVNLLSTSHTGQNENEESFLEIEWQVSVSCWENCPTEPVFGAEARPEVERMLRRRIEIIEEESTRRIEPADGSSGSDYQTISWVEAGTDVPIETEPPLEDTNFGVRTAVSELEVRKEFEERVRRSAVAAGWVDPSQETPRPTPSPSENIFAPTEPKIIIDDDRTKDVEDDNAPDLAPPVDAPDLAPRVGAPDLTPPTTAPSFPPSESPSQAPTVCTDNNDDCFEVSAAGECLLRKCAFWAREGECGNNPAYMTEHCAKSCGKCTSETPESFPTSRPSIKPGSEPAESDAPTFTFAPTSSPTVTSPPTNSGSEESEEQIETEEFGIGSKN